MTDSVDIDFLPENIRQQVQSLLAHYKHDSPYKSSLIIEVLRLASGNYDNADVKMLSKMLAELRQGLDVFTPYQSRRKVAIFGSARTPEDSPRYQQAKLCAESLKQAGFMVITGGGGGMMQAANEGA
ncbi:MAG: LOG family protein, partial [Mariprofundus sp.]